MEEINRSHIRRFRNHISVILEQSGAAFAALIVIAVTQGIQYVDEISQADLSFFAGKGFLVFAAVAGILILALVSQLLVWARTYISIEENAVVIEKGSLNKKKNTIGIRNISNINLEQNLIEMLFGTCKVKMDTNSRSTADSTDVKIVLKKADAEWFRREIMIKMETARTGSQIPAAYDRQESEDYDVRCVLADILQHGFFSISLLSVFVFLVALAGTVISVAEILERKDLMSSIAGAAAGVLVAVSVVISLLWDTVKDFVRYFDFRAKRMGDKIYIKYGFFKKVEYTIPVDKIQALKVRQSFIARLGRRYMAEIINVGMGDDQEEKNSFLILYCPEDKFAERISLLLPEYASFAQQKTDRIPSSVWVVWSIPAVIFAAVMVTGTILFNSVMDNKYSLPAWGVTAGTLIFMAVCMILKYRTAGVGADSHFLKIARGYFGRHYLSVKYADIQYAQFYQNFAARACGIRKGEIHLLASSLNSAHSIPYFGGDKEEVIKRGMLAKRSSDRQW